jgi:hypothetical protein
MSATARETLVREYQVLPDVSVTRVPGTTDELVAQIKAIHAAVDAGPGAYGNTRLWWLWNTKDRERHSAAVKRTLAPMVGQRWRWDWRLNPPCEGCGNWFERAFAGRERLYCSNACRQRAYRGRKA